MKQYNIAAAGTGYVGLGIHCNFACNSTTMSLLSI